MGPFPILRLFLLSFLFSGGGGGHLFIFLFSSYFVLTQKWCIVWGAKTAISSIWHYKNSEVNDIRISFEPGFGAYQGLAQKIEVAFSRIFSFFLQFWGFEGDFKTRAKPRYAPNSGWNAFRNVAAQRKSFGVGYPRWIPGRTPGPQNFLSHRSEHRKIKVFARTSLTWRHKAWTSMTRGDIRKTLCKKVFVPYSKDGIITNRFVFGGGGKYLWWLLQELCSIKFLSEMK